MGWTTPGGQARYSDLAIETALILRAVFHQPLRQTEGLVGSLLELFCACRGIFNAAPDAIEGFLETTCVANDSHLTFM